MINIFAIIAGILLGIINIIIYPFIHMLVLHGGANEIPYNILHMLLQVGMYWCIIYGVLGITWACLGSILVLVIYTIARLKNEYFEWRIK